MTTFSFKDVDDAYGRVKSLILKTPLVSNEEINKITKANVFFKLENLQWTGSFKLRGASNKIDQLTKNEKKQGSSGLFLWESCPSSSLCIKTK
ncbi:MAG TPA: pyridoxal-phosphate dependent enzyme [Pelagibacterales bacterium]|nr:pyridoxal-phosphate dependent enzyme [Pelagibacterales bacterium]